MHSEIISESDFEDLPIETVSTPVAIQPLGSHLTYRQNKKEKWSPISDPVVAAGENKKGSHTVVVKPDQINNLTQKENAMAKAGVTREKTYGVIARLLDAKRWTDVVDSQGNVRRELVDDLDKQNLGVEKALRAFGDMIERREIEVDVGDKTLEAYRSMSVVELKAKAAQILLGKNVIDITQEV